MLPNNILISAFFSHLVEKKILYDLNCYNKEVFFRIISLCLDYPFNLIHLHIGIEYQIWMIYSEVPPPNQIIAHRCVSMKRYEQ